MVSSQAEEWEAPLLRLAGEARASGHTAPPAPSTAILARAYAYCTSVTAVHGRTFHLAASLLPADKRRAARALYAFCRIADDIVDTGGADASRQLAAWRRQTLAPPGPSANLVAIAWDDTRRRYRIPQQYAEQLLQGIARDFDCPQYRTFDDLAAYAYGVASTVGLMLMHIVGFSGPAAIPYAVKLGIALQVTNILRDVGEDWRAGRLYLPTTELAAYGLAAADLARGRVDDRWRAFMRFQIDRNRRLYAAAWPGIAMLSRDGRFAVAAASVLYQAILDDIEAHDYDVFTRRAHVSTWDKLRRLPGIWWRVRPREGDAHATL
ncbi:MAG: phytoene/squalene synthase family protein [Thermomicrobiales bacterium]